MTDRSARPWPPRLFCRCRAPHCPYCTGHPTHRKPKGSIMRKSAAVTVSTRPPFGVWIALALAMWALIILGFFVDVPGWLLWPVFGAYSAVLIWRYWPGDRRRK